MNKTIMSCPSGSLAKPSIAPSPRCLKSQQQPMLITGYAGITYTSSKGRTGKTNPHIFGATLRRHWLPEGITGWTLNFRDKWEFKRFRERLTRLIKHNYAGEDTEIVEEVLRRDATPGALAALRYCDWFIASGGAMRDVGILGNVVLKSGIDTDLIAADSINKLSTVSLALIDSKCDPEAYLDVVKLVLEQVENSDLISEIITNRGITDALVIREMLRETLSTASAVRSGVL